ncbi:recombination protein NinG [Pseudomonas sp. MDT2-39-1]
MIAKQPKPKKCKNPACGISFPPQRLGQAVCSPKCGLAIKDVNQEKARKSLAQIERKEIKVRKEKLKSRADHLKDTQVAFNAWVRARDDGSPCISCGTTANVQFCAGHYRTVGSCPELRFEPLNVHIQCNKNCNLEKSGNIVSYRPRLLEKIGAERLDWLEGPHEPKKYTIEELKAMTADYRAKTRELKGRAA